MVGIQTHDLKIEDMLNNNCANNRSLGTYNLTF